jgi:hypothetical protein
MEYHFDWNLWTILENGSKVQDGFRKEYDTLLPYIPHFKDALELFLQQGEPGVLFLKTLAQYTRECVTAREQGKKIAITTFCFAPSILYAMDIQPISLEPWSVLGTMVLKRGTAEYMDYCCELGFTETSCSGQRGSLGAYLAGLGVKPDFVLMDTAGICDTNGNSFSFCSSYFDIPLFQLNFPPTLTDERATDYHRKDFKALISFLEEQTGKKLDQDKLKVILEETKRQDELCSEIMDLQRLIPSPMPPIYDIMLYGAKFMMSGKKEMTGLLESMVKKVRENAKLGRAGTTSGKEKIRGMMCYIDHYTTDARLWDWMDQQEISHIGSLLFNFWQKDNILAKGKEEEGYAINMSNLDTMIDSLVAQNTRMPMVKQIRGPYDAPGMWLDDVLGAAKIMKPDFVTYMGTMGCRNSWGMVKPFARDMERLGYPTLIIYADSFDDRVASWESIRDKIQEFIKVRRIIS